MSDVNIRSFLPHEKLSQKFWDEDQKLKPEVREALLNIASEFLEYLKIDVDVSDITFTGSYSNYNYTPYSDIDLHIVIEFADVNDNEELVKGFMSAKKSYWNDKYDIEVLGAEVEIYPQDASEEHISSGVYSIENDEWVVKPDKFQKKPNTKAAYKKFKMLSDQIDDVLISDDEKEVERILKKIKKMRQSGLSKSGEMSIENIAYKMLRSKNLIQKLFDKKFKLYGDSISL
jgi:predicted nucleotidyltransferase